MRKCIWMQLSELCMCMLPPSSPETVKTRSILCIVSYLRNSHVRVMQVSLIMGGAPMGSAYPWAPEYPMCSIQTANVLLPDTLSDPVTVAPRGHLPIYTALFSALHTSCLCMQSSALQNLPLFYCSKPRDTPA